MVAEDIKTLNDYGYEVLSYKRRYHYYYVVNRPFGIAEIVMLTDVVKSSSVCIAFANNYRHNDNKHF